MNTSAPKLQERLRALPPSPGVYLFKDVRSRIIYVGKASRLRNRVRSYFGSQTKFTPKLVRLVEHIADFEFFVTASEEEALILELNLIKKFRPRYNITLKDDKSFPYLKIDTADDYPRVLLTRRVLQDGGRYFGPFANAGSVRTILNLIKRIFPFRSCSRPITGKDKRACLDYHIKRCLAPCIGAATKEEYDNIVRQVTLFLEGRLDTVLKEMRRQMGTAAEHLEFEKAAMLRNQIRAVEQVIQEQRIATTVKGDQDVIAFARDGNATTVQVFFIRNGKLTGREHFELEGTRYEQPSQIMSVFVKRFYASATAVPPLLLLQYAPDDIATIQQWLSRKRGSTIRLIVPQRGGRKLLVETVSENARHEQEQRRIAELASSSTLSRAFEDLKVRLNLPQPPHRIECYDISNISGTSAVGSMVVFEEGKPARSQYRKFRINTVEGVDDYAMMREVLGRRFKRHEQAGGPTQNGWGSTPDLVLIDGGKGHLGVAMEVLEQAGMPSIAAAAIAKEHEEIFLPGAGAPLGLPNDSPALHMLQRIRDEAHRFAIGYHRGVRNKQAKASLLDAIPGIGPKRKRALLKRFGSPQALANVSIEEIAAVEGMNRAAAEKVRQYIQSLQL